MHPGVIIFGWIAVIGAFLHRSTEPARVAAPCTSSICISRGIVATMIAEVGNGNAVPATTRCIKADPSLSSIPIIAVTSYALSGDEEKARAAGCNDFVPKPYSPRQLLAKIRQYLP